MRERRRTTGAAAAMAPLAAATAPGCVLLAPSLSASLSVIRGPDLQRRQQAGGAPRLLRSICYQVCGLSPTGGQLSKLESCARCTSHHACCGPRIYELLDHKLQLEHGCSASNAVLTRLFGIFGMPRVSRVSP